MGCHCAKIHVPSRDCPKCESGWATEYYLEWCKNFPNDPKVTWVKEKYGKAQSNKNKTRRKK